MRQENHRESPDVRRRISKRRSFQVQTTRLRPGIGDLYDPAFPSLETIWRDSKWRRDCSLYPQVQQVRRDLESRALLNGKISSNGESRLLRCILVDGNRGFMQILWSIISASKGVTLHEPITRAGMHYHNLEGGSITALIANNRVNCTVAAAIAAALRYHSPAFRSRAQSPLIFGERTPACKIAKLPGVRSPRQTRSPQLLARALNTSIKYRE